MLSFNMGRWLKTWVRRRGRTIEKKPRLRLAFEELEDRLAPALVWTGGGGAGNNNWSNPANWVGGVFPTAGSSLDLDFNSTASFFTANNDIAGLTINQMTFGAGANYTLTQSAGRSITLGNPTSTNGLILLNTSAVANIGIDMQLGGPVANSELLDLRTGTTLTLSGQLFGSSATQLTKQGVGTLILSADNSGFLGPFKANNSNGAGVVSITNQAALGAAITSELQFIDLTSATAGATRYTVTYPNGTTNPTTAPLTFNNDANDATSLQTALNTLFNGLSFAGTPVTVTRTASSATSARFSLAFSGTLTGTNVLQMSPAISTAPGTVSSGTYADGGAPNTTTITPSQQLQINIAAGGAVTNPLIVGGAGAGVFPGALLNVAGNNTWSGTITMETGGGTNVTTMGVLNAASTLTITGQISNTSTTPYTFNKEGPGTLFLNPLNTAGNVYAGVTNINNGVLVLGHPYALGVGSTTANATFVNTNAVQSGTIAVNYTANPFIPAGQLRYAQVQTLTFTGTTAGTQYNLGYNGAFTPTPVNYTGVAATDALNIQTALNALSTIVGVGASVSVVSAGGGVFNITFGGSLGGMQIPVVNVNIAGGPGSIIPGTTTGLTPIGFQIPDELLTLSGPGFTAAPFENRAGHNAWEPLITFATGITVNIFPNTNFTADGSITGGALTKIGGGRLILPTANTIAPIVTILAGAVNVRDSNAMGGPTANVTVSTGSSVELQADAIPDSVGTAGLYNLYFPDTSTFNITGNGVNGVGAIYNMAGVNKIVGDINMTGANNSIGVAPDPDPANVLLATYNNLSQLTIDGVISGGGTALTKVGYGELVLTNQNTYNSLATGQNTYQTFINEGWITINNNFALGGTVANLNPVDQPGVQVLDGASLMLKFDPQGNNLNLAYNMSLAGTGITHRFPWLSGMGALVNLDGSNVATGDIYLEGPAAIGVEIDGANAVPNPSQLTLTGLIHDGASPGELVKLGSQKLILQGAGTYTGGVDIRTGVLRIHNDTALGTGSPAGDTTTIVQSGAALELAPTVPLANGGIQRGLQIWYTHLVLNGTGNAAFGDAPLMIESDDNAWRGPITLNSNLAVTFRNSLAKKALADMTVNNTALVGGGSITIDTTTPGGTFYDAVQTLTFNGNITSGSFTLTVDDGAGIVATTAPIVWNASIPILIARIESALNALASNFDLLADPIVAVATNSPIINIFPNARFVVTGAMDDVGASNPGQLVHQYELNGSYADALGGPSLVPTGGVLGATNYSFNAGGRAAHIGANEGLTLNGALSPGDVDYSIQLVCTIDELPPPAPTNYIRLIDWLTLTPDDGLYIHTDYLDLYPTAASGPGGVFGPGPTTFTLVITRSPTGTMEAYINGVLQFSALDATSGVVSPTGNLKFFIDDILGVPNEISSGSVDRILIYNRALNAAEVGIVTAGSSLASAGTGSPADLNIIGGGELVLAGANTYRGMTNLEQGILTISNPSSLGAGAIAEKQDLTLGPIGTTFTLSFNGSAPTGPLTYTGGAGDRLAIENALNGLATIGGLSVGGAATVTQTGNVFTITLGGTLAGFNQPAIVSSSPDAVVTTTTEGAGATTVADHTQLQLQGGITVTAEPLRLEGQGNPLQSEVQRLAVGGPVSGTFQLTFAGDTTGDLPMGATAAEVQAALNQLASIQAGDGSGGGSVAVNVTGQGVYTVAFRGTFAGTAVPQIFASVAQQDISLGGTTGEFKLNFTGDAINFTNPMPPSATAGDLQAEINNLLAATTATLLDGTPLTGGTASVAPTAAGTFLVTFGGTLAGKAVPLLIATQLYGVASVTVNLGGTGYGTPPLISFSGGGGSGASATAVVAAGALTAITVDVAGAGYSSAPTVGIGGPGMNATATAVLTADDITASASPTGATALAFTVVEGGSTNATPTQWFNAGPSYIESADVNLGAGNPQQNIAGPVTGIVTDPNDRNIIYISTAGGGTWKTTNGGATWAPLFDGISTVQDLTLTGSDPTTDTFVLTYTDPVTGVQTSTIALPYNAPADQLKAAVDQVVGLGNSVTVSQIINTNGVNEQQQLVFDTAASSAITGNAVSTWQDNVTTFRLTFKSGFGNRTSWITYDNNSAAMAVTLQNELNNLNTIQGAGNTGFVTVTTTSQDIFVITFLGSMSASNQPAVTFDIGRTGGGFGGGGTFWEIPFSSADDPPVPFPTMNGALAYHVNGGDNDNGLNNRVSGSLTELVDGSGPTIIDTITFAGGNLAGVNLAPLTFTTTGGTTVGQSVTSVSMTNFGSGYTTPPTITFSGGGGSGAAGYATIAGFLDTINVTAGGTGYFTVPTVTVTGGGGAGATATAAITVAVATVTLTDPGAGYTSAPTITLTGGGGTGATASAVVDGGVSVVNVTNGGIGYTSAPTVTLTGGGGAGATATANIVAGVNSVIVTTPGAGYDAPPTVTFSGGGATTDATGVAVLNGSVTGVNVTNGGAYTGPVTVSFTGGGGGTGAAGTATTTGGVVGANVTSGGFGYTSAPTVTFTGGGGAGATGDGILDQGVLNVTMSSGGSYTSAPTVTFSGGGGAGATGTASMTNGVVSGTVLGGGNGYTAPTLDFIGGGGTGATGTADLLFRVVTGPASVTIDNGGTGYTSAPGVLFSGGGGSGATGFASFSGGMVTGVTVTSGGSGYTSAPSIVFLGGGGANAAATATMTGYIGSITVTAAGAGYTSAPAVSITDPTGVGASGFATTGLYVAGVSISAAGAGYTSAPTINFTGGGGAGAAGTANLIGFVVGVTITNPGVGYVSAPTANFSGGGGGGAAGNGILGTFVSSVTVTSPGSGYTSAPTVNFTGAGPGGATADATIAGSVGSITITSPGAGYTSAPTVTITPVGAGAGAAATATVASFVDTVTVTAPGVGYSSAPAVVFAGGGGAGAIANAQIAGGLVGITVTAGGTGYTSAPTVTITGGGGTGATATATIDGQVTGLTLTAPGNGYSFAPTLVFGGPGTGAAGAVTINASLTGILLTSGGQNYGTPPTVTITGGGGTGATAVATLGSAASQVGIRSEIAMFGGAIAMDPTDPNTLFFGTGEGNFANDTYYGTGVYQTTDGGRTWKQLVDTSLAEPNPLYGLSINKILVDSGRNVIYVATGDEGVNGIPGVGTSNTPTRHNPGVWRYDLNALTWLNLTNMTSRVGGPGSPGPDDFYLITFPQQNASWTDISFGAGELYAALSTGPTGVYHVSLNAAANANGTTTHPTWYLGDFSPTQLPPTVPDNQAGDFPYLDPFIHNLRIDAIPFGGALGYDAIIATMAGAFDTFDRILLSVNGGLNWTAVAAPPANYMGNNGDFATALVALNAGDFFVAGHTDSGNNYILRYNGAWTDLTPTGSIAPHTNVHAMTFSGGNLIVGTDGGVWRYDLGTSTWFNLNGNLANIAFDDIESDPTDPNRVFGTGRGIGTVQFDGNQSWTQVDGAHAGNFTLDTGTVVIDPNDLDHLYHSQDPAQFSGASNWISNDGGATWVNAPIGGGQTRQTLYFDTHGRIFVGTGSNIYYASPLTAGLFTSVHVGSITARDYAVADLQGPFQADPFFPSVTDGGASNPDANTIYFTDGTGIEVTKDFGATWDNTRGMTLLPNNTIVDLQIDPGNRDVLYAVVSGELNANGVGRVWKTTDAGRTWTVIGSSANGLPDRTPAWVLALDPRNGNLYLGTDNGVYLLPAGAAAWQKFGASLPNVAIHDLDLNANTNILTAGTFGRSAYQFFLDTPTVNSGALRAAGGSNIWNAPIVLAGPTTISANGNQALMSGSAITQLTLFGGISDLAPATSTNTLTKVGKGDVVLASANIYGGATLLNEGNLVILHPNALGTTTQPTTVASGSILQLNTSLSGEPLFLYGDGVQNNGHWTGALENINGNNTYDGVLTMMTNTTIGVDIGSSLTIASPGTITDGTSTFTLTKEDKGTLVLASANSYDGNTFVYQGALNIQNSGAFGPSNTTTTVSDGAQLQLQGGVNVTTQRLILSGVGIANSGALLNVSGNNAWGSATNGITFRSVPSFAPESTPGGVVAIGVTNPGDTLQINGAIGQTQPTGLSKVGAGRLNLGQADTYSGTTYVNAGILAIQNGAALGTNNGQAVQRITTLDPGFADNFTLSFNGSAPTPIPLSFGSAANTVQAALNGLSTIGTNGVTVTSNTIFSGISEVQTLTFTNPAALPAAPTWSGLVVAAGGSFAAGTYYYVITAVTPSGETMASPERRIVVTAGQQTQLTWNAFTTALSYRIYRSTTPGGYSAASLVATVTGGTNFTDTGLPAALPPMQAAPTVTAGAGLLLPGQYYYLVSAIMPTTSASETLASNEQSALVATVGDEINLSWSAVAGATGYRIYRSTTSGSYPSPSLRTTVGLVTTYTDLGGGVGAGTPPTVNGPNLNAAVTGFGLPVGAAGGAFTPGTYFWVITAISANGESTASVQQSIPLLANQQATLTWNSVAGATSYRVYRSTTSGVYTNASLVAVVSPSGLNTTSYIDKGENAPVQLPPTTSPGGVLAPNIYYYVITSVTANSESIAGNEMLVGVAAGEQVDLSWNAGPAGTTGYRIYRSTKSGVYGAGSLVTTINSGAVVAFTDTGATAPTLNPVTTAGGTLPAGTYYYVITATNATGESAASVEERVVLNGAESASLSWNLVAGATGYKIFRTTTPGVYPADSLVQTIASGATIAALDNLTTPLAGRPMLPGAPPTMTAPVLQTLCNLTFNGVSTATPIGFTGVPSVDAALIQTALNGLSTFANPGGNTQVPNGTTLVTVDATGKIFTITFGGGLAQSFQPLIAATVTQGTATAAATEKITGAGGLFYVYTVRFTAPRLAGPQPQIIAAGSTSLITASVTTVADGGVGAIVSDGATLAIDGDPTTLGGGTGINAPSGGPVQNALSVTGGGSLVADTYFYVITAITAAGESYVSNERYATVSAGDQITLSWNAVTGATAYKVYRSTTSGVFGANALLFTTNAGTVLGFLDTGLTTPTLGPPAAAGPGSLAAGTYFYVVSAVFAGGESVASTEQTVTSAAGQHVDLSWVAVPGAIGYRIYRTTTTGVYGAASIIEYVTSGATTTYADNGSPTLSSATVGGGAGTLPIANYCYVVSAINAAGETLASNERNANVTVSPRQVTLAWTAVTGATGYKIYRRLDTGTYRATSLIATTGMVTTYIDGSLASDNAPPVQNLITTTVGGGTLATGTYFYIITATTATNQSPDSNQQSVVLAAGNQANLSWSAVPGATGYNVYRSTTTGVYTSPALVASVVTNSYTDDGSAVLAATDAPILTGAPTLLGTPPMFTVVLNGNGVGALGALRNLTGVNTWTGQVMLQTSSSIGADPGTTMTITGIVQDPLPAPIPPVSVIPPNLTKVGTGTVILSNYNTHSGNNYIAAGALNMQDPHALGINTDTKQTVTVSGTMGSLALQFNGFPALDTGPLPYSLDEVALELALNTLLANAGAPGGGLGTASVFTEASGNTFVVTFGGSLAGKQVPLLMIKPGSIVPNVNAVISEILAGAASGTYVQSGATLQMESAVSLKDASGKTLTINGAGLGGAGALQSVAGVNTWDDTPVVLGSNASIGANLGATLLLASSITDSYQTQDITFPVAPGFIPGHTYNVGFGGFTSGSLTYSALTATNASDLQTALQGLLSVSLVQGTVNVSFVSGSTYRVSFLGTMAGLAWPDVKATRLTGLGTITVAAAAPQGGTNGYSVTKVGAGLAQYFDDAAVPAPNAYTGMTTVADGTLEFNKASAASANAAILGGLTVGDATGLAGSAIARLLLSDQIPDASNVTVRSDGLFEVNYLDETIGDLTINGGVVTTGTGMASTGTATPGGSLTANSATLTTGAALNAIGDASSVVVDGPANVTGSSVTASGANSFVTVYGPTSLTSSSMTASGAKSDVWVDGVMTATTSTVTLSGDECRLVVSLSLSLINSNLTASGTASYAWILGPFNITDSTVTLSGDDCWLGVDGSLTLNNSTVTTSGVNSWVDVWGLTTMTGGLIDLAHATSEMSLGDNLTASSDVLGAATITGPGTLDIGAATRTFTVTHGAGATVTSDLVVNSVITGTAGVIKAGAGRLELNSASTYTGTTRIDAGDVQVDELGRQTLSLTGFSAGQNFTLTYTNGTKIGTTASITFNSDMSDAGNIATALNDLLSLLFSPGLVNVIATGNPNVFDVIFTGAAMVDVIPLAITSGAVTTSATSVNNIGAVVLNGGTLGGTGTVAGVTMNTPAATGTVNPGANATADVTAVLEANGNVVWTNNSTFVVDLGDASGTHPVPTPGADHDQLYVNGGITLGNALLTGNVLDANIAIADQITIIRSTGAVTGALDGIISGVRATIAQGGPVFLSGQKFTLHYYANSVVLTRELLTAQVSLNASVPSPSSYGQAVVFTATVTPEPGGGALPLGGTVTFVLDKTTTLPALPDGPQKLVATLSSSGQMIFAPTFNPQALFGLWNAGTTHTIDTVFQDGSGNYNTTIATQVSDTVVKAIVNIGIVSVPASPIYGQSATVTATVTPGLAQMSGAVAPSGSVSFTLDAGSPSSANQAINGSGQAQWAIPFASLTGGAHAIHVVYDNGDINYAASVSPTNAPVNVTPDTTIVSFVSPPATASLGAPATLNVRVDPVLVGSTGVPIGTLRLYDGSTAGPLLDTQPYTSALPGSIVAMSTTNLSVGVHTLVVTFTPTNTNYAPATAPLSQASTPISVSQATTQTTVTGANPTSSNFGDTVTFTVQVIDSPDIAPIYGTPAGNVTFYQNSITPGNAIASGVVDINGFATGTTAALPAGSHTIIAVYAGLGNFLGSTGTLATPFVVGPATTTTTLNASPSSSVFGQSVQLTATITSAVVGLPAGSTMTFWDGPVGGTGFLGSGIVSIVGSAGQASIFTSVLTVGSHTLNAKFVDNNDPFVNYSSSIGTLAAPFNVGAASTVTTIRFSPSSSGPFGGSVAITAHVTSPTGTPPVGSQVTFYDGPVINNVQLGTGTLNGAQDATINTTTLQLGLHTINAVYVDNDDAVVNFAGSTGTNSYTINPASTTTTLTASPPSGTLFGQTFNLIATITSATGPVPVGGMVTFKEGAATLGTANVIDAGGGVRSATFPVIMATAAAHTYSAFYTDVPDDNFADSNGSMAPYAIGLAATEILSANITSSAPASGPGQLVTLTARVTTTQTPTPNAAIVDAGSITFRDATTNIVLGTAAVNASGIATLPNVSFAAVGPHTIEVQYLGNAPRFAASAITTFTQSVLKSATINVNPITTGNAFGQTLNFQVSLTGTGPEVPSGTITVRETVGAVTTTWATVAYAGTGTVSVPVTGLGAGTHQLVFSYSGNAFFAPTTKPAITQTVVAASTTTTLANLTTPLVYGVHTTFTATVASTTAPPGPLVGNVIFKAGTLTLATVPLTGTNVAQFTTTSFLATGSHSITATFSNVGNTNFNSSVASTAKTQVVTAVSTQTLLDPLTPTNYGNPITFRATVNQTGVGSSAPNPTAGTVTFKDGTTTLKVVTLTGTNVAQFTTTTNLTGGTHNITAVYSGSAPNYKTSTSAVNPQVINKAGVTVTITPSVPDGTLTYGKTVTLTALVSVATGGAAGTPIGTVSFFGGALGTTLLKSGVALVAVNASTAKAVYTTTATQLSAITHTINATYNGGTNFTANTSGITYIVLAADTTTTLTSSPWAVDMPATITATVVGASGGTPGTPTGTVTFFVDGVPQVPDVTLSAGKATFTTTFTSQGPHDISATYYPAGATPNFATSSTLVAQDVRKFSAVDFTSVSTLTGVNVMVTVTTTPGGGIPTGTVTLKEGALILGTVTLNANGVGYIVLNLAPGNHTIVATYNGDNSDPNFNPATKSKVIAGKLKTRVL